MVNCRFVLVSLDFHVDLNVFVCGLHACLHIYQAVAELCFGWTARNVFCPGGYGLASSLRLLLPFTHWLWAPLSDYSSRPKVTVISPHSY